MTTATRQAIAEMRKRGFNNLDIIQVARWWAAGRNMATALVDYVAHTRNIRWCPSCHGEHFIQNCGEIRAAMAGASNGFLDRFKGDTTR